MGRIRSEQIGRGRGSDTGREYASVCWRAPAVGVVCKAGRPWWLRVTCADVYGSGMVSTATRQPACHLARAPEQRWRVKLVPAVRVLTVRGRVVSEDPTGVRKCGVKGKAGS